MSSITNLRYRKLAILFKTLGQPVRLRILLAIGRGEACVCHLESRLGLRQAFISQHLMALRRTGLVTDRREGRYVFYRLRDADIMEVIRLAGRLVGITEFEFKFEVLPCSVPSCPCPHCSEEVVAGRCFA